MGNQTTSEYSSEGDYGGLYDRLGVPKNASSSTIRAAYFSLAKKYHPDKNISEEDTTEKFQQIQEAYTVLMDPTERKRYDLLGFEEYFHTIKTPTSPPRKSLFYLISWLVVTPSSFPFECWSKRSKIFSNPPRSPFRSGFSTLLFKNVLYSFFWALTKRWRNSELANIITLLAVYPFELLQTLKQVKLEYPPSFFAHETSQLYSGISFFLFLKYYAAPFFEKMITPWTKALRDEVTDRYGNKKSHWFKNFIGQVAVGLLHHTLLSVLVVPLKSMMVHAQLDGFYAEKEGHSFFGFGGFYGFFANVIFSYAQPGAYRGLLYDVAYSYINTEPFHYFGH